MGWRRSQPVFNERHLPFHARHPEAPSYDAREVAQIFQAEGHAEGEDELLWLRQGLVLSLEELAASPPLATGRYEIKIDGGLSFPCFYRRNSAQSDRLYVLFQGAVGKNINQAIFPRITWGPWLPGDCLHISDPLILRHKDLGLSWYLGYNDLDLYERAARTIALFADKAGYDRIYSYGSSGGGFAALKISEYLPMIAIGLNPQIDCSKYQPFFNAYLKSCGVKPGPELLQRARLSPETDSPRFIMQNILDGHHFPHHFLPFLKERGLFPKYGFSRHGNLAFLLYRGIQGHEAMENKAILRIILQFIDMCLDGRISDEEADDSLIPLFELWNSVDGLNIYKKNAGLV